ncbi:hypothetical protein ACP275_11G043600 [Erythranthe tilingii]
MEEGLCQVYISATEEYITELCEAIDCLKSNLENYVDVSARMMNARPPPPPPEPSTRLRNDGRGGGMPGDDYKEMIYNKLEEVDTRKRQTCVELERTLDLLSYLYLDFLAFDYEYFSDDVFNFDVDYVSHIEQHYGTGTEIEIETETETETGNGNGNKICGYLDWFRSIEQWFVDKQRNATESYRKKLDDSRRNSAAKSTPIPYGGMPMVVNQFQHMHLHAPDC